MTSVSWPTRWTGPWRWTARASSKPSFRLTSTRRRSTTKPLRVELLTLTRPGHGPKIRHVPETASQTAPATVPWQGRLPFFYGWVIVALGFFTSFFGIGLTWAASIFSVPMRDELGWSRSEIFFAVSMRGWIGIVASPIVGRYLDQRNGVRIMTLIGGVMNATSLLLISQVNSQWQFLLLFGVMGG